MNYDVVHLRIQLSDIPVIYFSKPDALAQFNLPKSKYMFCGRLQLTWDDQEPQQNRKFG